MKDSTGTTEDLKGLLPESLGVFEVHFDGGCRPKNPGNKYGSFEVLKDGVRVDKMVQVEFGHGTNNEAEFEALLLGLKVAQVKALESGMDLKWFQITCYTDSMILLCKLRAKKVRGCMRLVVLAQKCKEILTEFGSWEIQWNRREKNVSRFGH